MEDESTGKIEYLVTYCPETGRELRHLMGEWPDVVVLGLRPRNLPNFSSESRELHFQFENGYATYRVERTPRRTRLRKVTATIDRTVPMPER